MAPHTPTQPASPPEPQTGAQDQPFKQPLPLAALASLILAKRPAKGPFLLGLTGSVASGKTTLAGQIVKALALQTPPETRILHASTDGFLRPNSWLEPRGLLLRKGFPESYDLPTFKRILQTLRQEPVRIPAYSHSLYDIDPNPGQLIDKPDIFLIEGLGFQPDETGYSVAQELDCFLYLDAEAADLEYWFVERFMGYWHEALKDPHSFYRQFTHFTPEEARNFAKTTVWEGVNLPNLQQHIIHARALADLHLWKNRDHSLFRIRPCLPSKDLK